MKNEVNLEWNVYYENFNDRRIEVINIFDHSFFKKDCDNAYKKYKNNYNSFINVIKSNLFYYFCSKCEWEIIISNWPPTNDFNNKKIDVYQQVMLNWEVFIQYVWNKYCNN